MNCCCDDQDDLPLFDSDGCYNCIEVPRVKGRFGLAWVSESPECPNPEPTGWQVEFYDTPSKVEQKCQEMVRWVNCPPLPRCDPCPPNELCSPKCPPRCNPCAPKTNPCQPRCDNRGGPSRPSSAKRCCCCGQSGGGARGRNCFPPPNMPFCRRRSPPRRRNEPKCTCDDIPVKDTGMDSLGDYKLDTTNNTYYNSNSPKQAITINAIDGYHPSSRETVTLYRNENHAYNTDNEFAGCDTWGAGEERLVRTLRLDDGAETKTGNMSMYTHGRSTVNEDGASVVANNQGDGYSRCGPCCSKNIQLQEQARQKLLAEKHRDEDGCGCRCMDGEDNKKHDDKESYEESHSHHKDDESRSKDDDSTHKPKRHHHILPKFLHHDHDKHHSVEKHRSMDSLDEALMKMNQDKSLHAGRPHLHSEEMQRKHVDRVDTEVTHHTGKKHRRRPFWLSPLLFNLCFKSKDSRSDHKQKKSKTPTGHHDSTHHEAHHDTHHHDGTHHETHHDTHHHDGTHHETHHHDNTHHTHGHAHHDIHLVTIEEMPESS